jgi:hypothetical protein
MELQASAWAALADGDHLRARAHAWRDTAHDAPDPLPVPSRAMQWRCR